MPEYVLYFVVNKQNCISINQNQWKDVKKIYFYKVFTIEGVIPRINVLVIRIISTAHVIQKGALVVLYDDSNSSHLTDFLKSII